jgi:hypothetical protein
MRGMGLGKSADGQGDLSTQELSIRTRISSNWCLEHLSRLGPMCTVLGMNEGERVVEGRLYAVVPATLKCTVANEQMLQGRKLCWICRGSCGFLSTGLTDNEARELRQSFPSALHSPLFSAAEDVGSPQAVRKPTQAFNLWLYQTGPFLLERLSTNPRLSGTQNHVGGEETSTGEVGYEMATEVQGGCRGLDKRGYRSRCKNLSYSTTP